MSADLSIRNGMAEMMYAGEVPWHGLGTKVKGLQTSELALREAHLDWAVELRDVYIPSKTMIHPEVPPGTLLKDSRHFATVREDDNTILGIVGKNYGVLQNRDAFGFFDSLVGEDQAIFETAGALDDGRRIWMLAKINHVMEVLPNDLIQQHCLLVHSHDGSCPVSVFWTPIRVVCSNTLAMAVSGGLRIVSIKHTNTVTSRIKKAGDLLKQSYEHLNELGESVAKFTSVCITDEQLEEYVEDFLMIKSLYTEIDEENIRALKIRLAKQERILEIYHGNDFGQDISGVRGTVWGAYSAVTAYVNHEVSKNTRNNNNVVGSLFFGNALTQNVRAFTLATKLVE